MAWAVSDVQGMEYICRGKGEYSGKWCIQRKQRGEAKEPGCDIVQCIDDR